MSHPLSFSRARPQVLRAFCLALAAVSLVAGARSARAQNQESGLLDRIDHPDRTLAFPLSNRNFGRTSAFKDKTANIKTFGFGKSASIAGDGKFRTQSFVSSSFKPKGFALRDGAAPGLRTYGETNRLFDTKSVDVRDARDANKTLAVQSFATHDPFTIRGKRQDTYDEMLKRKKLSIEEVRELLNKNH